MNTSAHIALISADPVAQLLTGLTELHMAGAERVVVTCHPDTARTLDVEMKGPTPYRIASNEDFPPGVLRFAAEVNHPAATPPGAST